MDTASEDIDHDRRRLVGFALMGERYGLCHQINGRPGGF